MGKNPFRLNEIPVDGAFCDREKSSSDLISYANSNTHTVLFSPRRYGKTSLVRRVQHQLRKSGFLTVYCDLFGVTSIEDIAARITRAIFVVTQPQEGVFKKAVSFLTSFRPVMAITEKGDISVSVQPAFKKAGLGTLDETMAGLAKFVQKAGQSVHIVLDEFQEITEVESAVEIEGILRSHIQKMPCAFVFVGSRRRILIEMFNERKRPFFQSAVNYELKPLPLDALTEYIVTQFRQAGKTISFKQSEKISVMLNRHPGYVQKYCFFLFETVKSKVTSNNMADAFRVLFENEKNYFESILQGLSTKQTALLIAIAREPEGKIFSSEYMSRHNLGSTGGIQNSLSVLSNRDLIEKKPAAQSWSLVDPVLRSWILEMTV